MSRCGPSGWHFCGPTLFRGRYGYSEPFKPCCKELLLGRGQLTCAQRDESTAFVIPGSGLRDGYH